MKKLSVLSLATACLVWHASSGWAQVESREGIALQNQIAELRQELQQQQSQGPAQNQGAPPPTAYQGQQGPVGSDSTAELVVRVSALEEQNRTLQGRVDDLTNQLQHTHDDLSKQIGDLSFKLGQGGGGGAAPAEDAQPTSEGAAPAPHLAAPRSAAAPQRRTPELALREGNAALARRDYAGAEAAAREAMAGRSPRGTDAQLLLARAEGGSGQYKEAAADFYQAYNHAPRGATAPVALLGVANSLIALKDNRDACQALAKLTAEFPGGARSGAALARKRAACGR